MKDVEGTELNMMILIFTGILRHYTLKLDKKLSIHVLRSVLCFCDVGEQRCPNGTCIPESDIQNGVEDCAEGKYDETGPFCNITYQLQCSNGRCISRDLFGNGVDDCNDNSDEVLNPCKLGAFSCSNKKCVSITWVLDSMDDCGDGSDEAKRIGTACDDTHCCPCQDYVTDSRCKEKTCQCIDGFYSNEARTTCLRRKI
ncbi:hypothetical protein LOTGIDRAFT_157000 [Lottia gigantea]|uniref:EGF-like domain-containing protein n=1 Tax=Lottia gigantea TaxID=225164 RepID=V4CL87_LOTGI|nr:hypothetical protein LOTGIDRAFT_157000 [Lottia gigantea]ESP03040.1 hypothetical protein LOTGIDRAFT_157000 [Lottia gigantea]